MTLLEYMRKNNISKKQLAQTLGYSDSALRGIFNGSFPVVERFANLIELYTKGEVKAQALMTRSAKAMKRKAEAVASANRSKSEPAPSCYGLCKMCNKKLNEIEL